MTRTGPSTANQATRAIEAIDVSVIVATHRRKQLVLQNLEALLKQDFPAERFEVIVSADSSDDGTADAIRQRALHSPVRVRVVEHSGRSASKTRNLGARIATGSWLIFIDDDITPEPGFVSAHVAARSDGRVNIGYARPIKTLQNDAWHQSVWRWWEDTFERSLRTNGHQFRYTDFLSGNFGISASLFTELGGFDETFTTAWEDFEFGLRLIRHGVSMAYLPGAVGDHAFGSTVQSHLKRRHQEGRASVQFGRVHPELRMSLFDPMYDAQSRKRAALIAIAQRQKPADWLVDRLAKFGSAPKKTFWRERLLASTHAQDLRFWQGVFAEIGTTRHLLSWLQDSPTSARISTDAPVAELQNLRSISPHSNMNEVAPGCDTRGLRVNHFGAELLRVPPEVGAEPLRVEHVLALAAKKLSVAFSGHEVMSSAKQSRCHRNERRTTP